MTLQVDVVSDVICPWCYVAKRRIEAAIAGLEGQHEVSVAWRPFELNPNMPKEGMDRREYRSRKFGSWERSLELDAQVARAGKGEGIEFAHERIERTPNTRDAHRLLWIARRKGVQNEVAERLFRAYFVEGVDLGRLENLVEVARAASLDPHETERSLCGDEGAEEVRLEEAEFQALGISGVPFVIVDGKYSVSGAQSLHVFLNVFRQALAEREQAIPTDGQTAPVGATCSADRSGAC